MSLLDFPNDILEQIFSNLSAEDIKNVSKTSARFDKLIEYSSKIIDKLTVHVEEELFCCVDDSDNQRRNYYKRNGQKKFNQFTKWLLTSKRPYRHLKICNTSRFSNITDILKQLKTSIETLVLNYVSDASANNFAKTLSECYNLRSCEINNLSFDKEIFEENPPLLPNLEKLSIINDKMELYDIFANCNELKVFSLTGICSIGAYTEEFIANQKCLKELYFNIGILGYEMFTSDILSNVEFQLDTLELGNISIYDPLHALKFFKSQQTLKSVTMPITSDWQICQKYRNLLKCIFSLPNLKTLNLVTSRCEWSLHHYFFKGLPINRNLENLTCDGAFFEIFTEIYPCVKNLNYNAGKFGNESLVLISKFEFLEMFRLEISANDILEKIQITSDRFTKFISRSTSYDFNKSIQRFLLNHPTISHVKLYNILQSADISKFTKTLPNLENLIVEFGTDGVNNSIKNLTNGFKNLKTLTTSDEVKKYILPETEAFIEQSNIKLLYQPENIIRHEFFNF